MKLAQSASGRRYPALFTALAAVLGLPFYLGLIHLPVGHLVLYSGVASSAMATGQYIDTPSDIRGGVQSFLGELSLWFALIVLLGGFAYLVALIF